MSDSAESPMLKAALRYIRMGWPVFPCWPHDQRNAEGKLIGKEPLGALVPHGCKDATLNAEQARAWWTAQPNANIGIPSGLRWWALDVDVKDGGEESQETWEHQHGKLPNTIQQITGTGGRHFLFTMPEVGVAATPWQSSLAGLH